MKIGRKDFDLSRVGKSYEEFYGEEKAKEVKENQSNSAKIREIHGHTGMKHTEESKQIMREKTIQRISNTKYKVSQVQQKLYEIVKEKYNGIFQVELEYIFGFYCLDIAMPELRICIETDGDFWHVNEEKGYQLIYESQKKNKKNEKSKNTFILNKNWSLLRIWESDINENIDQVKEKVWSFVETQRKKLNGT